MVSLLSYRFTQSACTCHRPSRTTGVVVAQSGRGAWGSPSDVPSEPRGGSGRGPRPSNSSQWFDGGNDERRAGSRGGSSSRPSAPYGDRPAYGDRDSDGRRSSGIGSGRGSGRDSSRGGGGGGRGGYGDRGRGDRFNGSSGYGRSGERGYGSSERRGPPAPRQEGADRPAAASGLTRDNFESAHKRLQEGQANNLVISREAWEKLFKLIRTPADAQTALELMRGDARVRDAVEWDWAAQGYGQMVFQLVGASANVGGYGLARELIGHATELRLNINAKDFFSGLMRKLGGAEAPASELESLYTLERELRGENTHMGAHELSRVYRREENADGVRALLKQAESGQAAIKPDLIEDLELWCAKRGL